MAVELSIPLPAADDDQTMIRVIRNLLTQIGFRNLDKARDGRQALEKSIPGGTPASSPAGACSR